MIDSTESTHRALRGGVQSLQAPDAPADLLPDVLYDVVVVGGTEAAIHPLTLAAFGNTGVTPTRRIYGNRGNSFVAVVEFGPRIRAQSVLAGGVSGDPRSPHFNDQAAMYAAGKFKDVAFYREDVERAAHRRYRPGQ